MKLYKVVLRGMTVANGNGVTNGEAYVVADDPTMAYHKVKNFLELKDWGFPKERELKTIELLAEENDFPDCGIRLFL
jgi:hypothetical protein